MRQKYPRDITHDQFQHILPIKHHFAVDTHELPHTITITTTNVTDRSSALEAFESSETRTVSIIKRQEQFNFLCLPR